ncbi:hypothetical protein [Brevibacillus choshinensis]|uniref:hypothetical protein n=1 Tax=Brevibacillus choshinensis TaxID=54911 RepID=UPI002E22A184|nr:hypothetical protein [Brevibacillus choshinensis]
MAVVIGGFTFNDKITFDDKKALTNQSKVKHGIQNEGSYAHGTDSPEDGISDINTFVQGIKMKSTFI